MSNPNYTISQLFTTYNSTRSDARQNGQDTGRIDRAFGLLQRNDGGRRPYTTTAASCNCPDSKFRPQHVCKHRRALQMQVQMAGA